VRLRSLIKRLRSPRLAIWLIVGLIAYAVVGTLVPQVSLSGGQAVGVWQMAHPWLAPLTRMLGLHVAFSSPIFFVLVAVLGASTAACAWARTERSLRVFRGEGTVAEADLRRLREHPVLTVPATGWDAAAALEAASLSLHRLRLRVRTGPRLSQAWSGRPGLLGSPVFHWALAALLVVIALGRLSRAEGFMGLALGHAKTDVAASYQKVSQGPLYPGHSGLTLLATDIGPYKDAEGVDRGVSPIVELSRGKSLLVRQRVYPNNPLRYGSLLIHASDYGLAAEISVETSRGVRILGSEQLVDFADSAVSGTTAARFDLNGPDGRVLEAVALTVPLDRGASGPLHYRPKEPRVVLSIKDGSVETTAVVAKGRAVALPSGLMIRLDDLVYYARVSIAEDWSIYPIYVLFVIAAAAMSLSVVAPYRRVLILAHDAGGRLELHALVKHSRGDPLFAERVEAALREAVAPLQEEKESA
jgi:hypothetical protein